MDPNLHILFVTHSGMRLLANAFLKILDRNYHPAPPVCAIIDTGPSLIVPTVLTSEKGWVASVRIGIDKLRSEQKLGGYVLLILDDLVPLRPVDTQTIRRHLSIAQRMGWKKLSLFIDAPEGHQFEVLSVEDESFFRIQRPGNGPVAFPWYNTLQVALWEINYLAQVCDQALSENVIDPWRFEHLVTNEDHYVSSYRWPAEFQGLHYLKNVQLKAVFRIQGMLFLKAYLCGIYFWKLPLQFLWRLRMKVKRMLSRL